MKNEEIDKKNRKMSNKSKRLNVLKILLFFCFGAIGHRILNRHAYSLLKPASKQLVNNSNEGNNLPYSQGPDIMVRDKTAGYYRCLIGVDGDPCKYTPNNFHTYPGGNTDEEADKGNHMNLNDCSNRSDIWSNSANYAAGKSRFIFPLDISRAIHFVQDMACIVHLEALSGSAIYPGTTYTKGQAHGIYEMKDVNGNSMAGSLYGLSCNGSNDCSYNVVKTRIDSIRPSLSSSFNTAKFWLNTSMRNTIVSAKKPNIKKVLDYYKNGSYNEIKNILIEDLAYAAVLMEKWLKYGPLSSHFTVP